MSMPDGIKRVRAQALGSVARFQRIQGRESMARTPRNLGQRIEDECRELGVTLHSVALEAKISPSTLHRWVHGSSSPWHALERVFRALEKLRSERPESSSTVFAAPDFWAGEDAKKERGA